MSEISRTSFSSSNLPLASRKCSSSKERSKWSTMACLPRPMMMMMSVSPAWTASSTTYWIAGLSRRGSISLGWALVAGRNRVPSPAAGMTAFRTFVIAPPLQGAGVYPQGATRRPDGVGGIPGYTCRMPTYEYGCTVCGQHIEVFQRFSEDALTTCGVCGGKLRKVFHPAGIVFKGSGFYATDSRSKATSGAASTKDSDGGSSSSGATSSPDSSSDTSAGSGGGATSKGGDGGSSSKGSDGGKPSTTGSKKESSSS